MGQFAYICVETLNCDYFRQDSSCDIILQAYGTVTLATRTRCSVFNKYKMSLRYWHSLVV